MNNPSRTKVETALDSRTLHADCKYLSARGKWGIRFDRLYCYYECTGLRVWFGCGAAVGVTTLFLMIEFGIEYLVRYGDIIGNVHGWLT